MRFYLIQMPSYKMPEELEALGVKQIKGKTEGDQAICYCLDVVNGQTELTQEEAQTFLQLWADEENALAPNDPISGLPVLQVPIELNNVIAEVMGG
jgi:hypothetical protein